MDLSKIKGFDWDEGNRFKNKVKHNVFQREAEEIFTNVPLIISPDVKHSRNEMRYYALGKSNNNRLIFIAFTFRKSKIRVISARDQSRKERRIYEKT